MTDKIMGHLLRSDTTGCVFGCRVAEVDAPVFGGMVRIPIEGETPYQIYGMIYDISIEDDGLVRQLVTAGSVTPEVVRDNRENRTVPLEVGVLFIGYRREGEIYHLLPPRPPLSLDKIFPCEADELCEFTSKYRFGYFRHILRRMDIPVGELLAVHLQQAGAAHSGDPEWVTRAAKELIVLLRDDYSTLMSVMSALGDTGLRFEGLAGGVL